MSNRIINITKDNKNILELYHLISGTTQELDDILTIDNGNTSVSDLDLQLTEKIEWKPYQEGEYIFDINGNTYTVKIEIDIPNEIVSRESDDDNTSGNSEAGLRFNVKKSISGIGATISNNTTGYSTAFLEDSEFNIIDTINISELSQGDAFGFTDINLSPDTYYLYIDCSSAGYFNGGNYPYKGEFIDITGQISETDSSGRSISTGQPRGINNLGNPQNILN